MGRGSGCAAERAVAFLAVIAAALDAGCDRADGQPSAAAAEYRVSSTCRLLADAPRWAEEGELVTIRVGCAGSGPFDLRPAAVRVSVSGLPAGAFFDPVGGTITWRPALDQAGTHTMSVRAVGSPEALELRVAVADRFDAPGNVPVTWPERYTEETGLPVLHLFLAPDVAFEEYRPARVVYRGRVHHAEAKLRGSSSREYPKKNFTVKFPRDALFADTERGFQSRRKIAVTTAFDDNSFIRQRLSFEAWNRVGRDNVAVQHMSAVVYVDGTYHGLYTITDHIDADLMEAHGLDRRGNLYKAIGPQANFYDRVPLTAVYEKKEGPEGDFGDLRDLMIFVNTADSGTFRRNVRDWIAVDDYRTWLIAATAMVAEDTLGKNAYHHHPGGGRWRVVPWDFNHSWGQAWDTARVPATKDPGELARQNHLFARLLEDEALGPETRARYAEALRGDLSADSVLALIDAYAAEVAAAAPRDERRWRQAYLGFSRWSARTDFTDFAGEIDYIRAWVAERWSYLGRVLAPQGAPQ